MLWNGSQGGDAGEACVRGVLEFSGTSQNAAVQVLSSHLSGGRYGAHAPEPDPPPEPTTARPLAGPYVLDCHVTNASGYLLNFENWQSVNPQDPPVLTGASIRNTRVRQVSTGLTAIFRNLDAQAALLDTLISEDFDDPDDAIDYVDAGLADYRLVASAAGRAKAVLSGWDLGALLNASLFS